MDFGGLFPKSLKDDCVLLHITCGIPLPFCHMSLLVDVKLSIK